MRFAIRLAAALPTFGTAVPVLLAPGPRALFADVQRVMATQFAFARDLEKDGHDPLHCDEYAEAQSGDSDQPEDEQDVVLREGTLDRVLPIHTADEVLSNLVNPDGFPERKQQNLPNEYEKSEEVQAKIPLRKIISPPLEALLFQLLKALILFLHPRSCLDPICIFHDPLKVTVTLVHSVLDKEEIAEDLVSQKGVGYETRYVVCECNEEKY